MISLSWPGYRPRHSAPALRPGRVAAGDIAPIGLDTQFVTVRWAAATGRHPDSRNRIWFARLPQPAGHALIKARMAAAPRVTWEETMNVPYKRHLSCRRPRRDGLRRAGPGRRVHQYPDRRHRRRLLSARRGPVENLRRQDSGQPAVGPVDQGLGREFEPAAGGQGRDRLHARRFAGPGLGGRQGSRLQGAAQEAARRRRDLSELHPARRDQGLGHQDDRRFEGQAHLGRRAQIGHRAQHPRGAQGRGPQLFRHGQGRVSELRRIGRADEEPAARRDLAIRRPRRRLDPRSRREQRHHLSSPYRQAS